MPHSDRALPYYCWFWKDWRANRRVQRLTWMQRGAYRELLDECWAEGFILDDTGKLAEIVGCSIGEMREMWPALKPLFSEDPENPGHLTSPRLEKERTDMDRIRVKRVKAGRKGGLAKAAHADPQGDLLGGNVASAKRGLASRVEKKRVEQRKGQKVINGDVASIVDAWNAKAKENRYAKVIDVSGKRLTHLNARLSEKGWLERALQAITYLQTDEWYRTNPSAVRFDTLLQVGKAEYYCERADVPRTNGATSRGGARTEVDSGIHGALERGGGRIAEEETAHA